MNRERQRSARARPAAPPTAVDGPQPGLYRVQWNQMAQAFGLPLLFWALPWPAPLRLVGYVLPPITFLINLGVILLLKCPACRKPLMIKGLTILPHRKCPHCRQVVA